MKIPIKHELKLTRGGGGGGGMRGGGGGGGSGDYRNITEPKGTIR